MNINDWKPVNQHEAGAFGVGDVVWGFSDQETSEPTGPMNTKPVGYREIEYDVSMKYEF